MDGSSGTSDESGTSASQQPSQQSLYKQSGLTRNYDDRIQGSKVIRSGIQRLATLKEAEQISRAIQASSSFSIWNPYTQGVNGWAEPLVSTNNYIDRTNDITSLQGGAQALLPAFDPCPMIIDSSGFTAFSASSRGRF